MDTQQLFAAIRELDQLNAQTPTCGTLEGISYAWSDRNSLASSWWAMAPFGKWRDTPTQPPISPFVQMLYRAATDVQAEAGDRPCFIDLTNLGLANGSIFTDDADGHGDSIIGCLARYINAQPSDAKPVIRYLVGDNNRIDKSYFTQNDPIYNAIKQHIRHPGAMLYCGNISPTVQVPDLSTGHIETFVETLLSALWQSVTASAPLHAVEDSAIRQLISTFEQQLMPALQPLLVQWIRVTGSWNHSKIFAMNGLALVTGGMNFWSLYQNQPGGNNTVLDLDISLRGDTAVDAHRFANYLWQRLSVRTASDPNSWCIALALDGSDAKDKPCDQVPMYSATPTNPNRGNALSVARNGDWRMGSFEYPEQIFDALRDVFLNLATLWIEKTAPVHGPGLAVTLCKLLGDDSPLLQRAAHKLGVNPMAWATRYARSHAIRHAQRHVRMSQQAVAQAMGLAEDKFRDFVHSVNQRLGIDWDGVVWPFDTFDAMSVALASMSKLSGNDRGIDIVCSYNHGGWDDPVHVEAFKSRLIAYMQGLAQAGFITPETAIPDLVNQLVRYKRVKDGLTGNGNHCKLTIVDDTLCYIGSDNAYPSYNNEFGVWIDDQAAIRAFIQDYWQGLQQHVEG